MIRPHDVAVVVFSFKCGGGEPVEGWLLVGGAAACGTLWMIECGRNVP